MTKEYHTFFNGKKIPVRETGVINERLTGLTCSDFIIKNESGCVMSCMEQPQGEYHLIVFKKEYKKEYKTIDDLPQHYRDFLFNEHDHNDETSEIIYSEKSVLKLLNMIL